MTRARAEEQPARWRYDSLPEYAFPRLRALLNGHAPGQDEINLSIGEPRHPIPDLVPRVLAAESDGYGRYPPNEGTPAFRAAAAHWLTRRYDLPGDLIDPDTQILPLNGTREGLFMAPQALSGPWHAPAENRPAILLPNPFYQCYAAAAVAAGAEPVFLDTTAETGHLPDFWSLSDDLLGRTMAVYLCSPANPQGTVADTRYWTRLMTLAAEYRFTIIADECYTEIYDRDVPAGSLDAARMVNPKLGRLLSFHSLSKRSSVPGLRSGFIAGDATLIARMRKLKSYGGAPSPLPVLAAATALWDDDGHVIDNRERYRRKIDIAAQILGGRFGFYRPPGGFFLWLDMSEAGLTGEEAALDLWTNVGLKVLPGAYLARDNGRGNPGTDYIRLALVHDEETTAEALRRLCDAL